MDKKKKKSLKEVNRSWLDKKLEYVKRSKRSKNSTYKGIMRVYLELVNNCSMPDCNYGYELEVHHIHPLNKGGLDTFNNLIILCRACHRRRHFHSNWEEKEVELLTLKFYKELSVLGFTSDCSDKEFLIKMAKYKAASKYQDSEEKIEI